MAQDWEWILVGWGGDKDLAFPAVLPSSGYGGRFAYDLVEPLRVRRYRAKHAPISIAETVMIYFEEQDGSMTVTPKVGPAMTGRIQSYQVEIIDGTTRCNVEVELVAPITELGVD